MPNTNYLIASPCNRHSPLATSPQRGMSSSIPMSPRRDLDRGSRHIVSWAPVMFFFFLDMFFFITILMSINGLNSAEPMYGHDRGSRGGVRARDVSWCVSYVYFGSIFFFYCIFFLIANLFIIIYSLVTTTITATASTTHFPSLSTTWLVTGGINELVWKGSEMANGRGMGPKQHLLLLGP